jgi:hypothetical protein
MRRTMRRLRRRRRAAAATATATTPAPAPATIAVLIAEAVATALFTCRSHPSHRLRAPHRVCLGDEAAGC